MKKGKKGETLCPTKGAGIFVGLGDYRPLSLVGLYPLGKRVWSQHEERHLSIHSYGGLLDSLKRRKRRGTSFKMLFSQKEK